MKTLGLLTLVALLGAPAANATVLDASPAGFTVENTVSVPVDPKTAWKALVENIDEWWPKEHSWFGQAGKLTLEASTGGCFCEKGGDRAAQHMTVSFVDPPHLLRMLGGLGPLQGMGLNGAMDWEFVAELRGTRVTLHYVAGGYSTTDLVKFATVVDHVQAQQLDWRRFSRKRQRSDWHRL